METKTSQEMQAIESWAMKNIGIDCCALMEMAGAKVAEFILREIRSIPQVTILAYKGNNSGDGFVCARHLFCAQVPVRVLLFCKAQDLKDEPRKNLEILQKLKVPIIEIHKETDLKNAQQLLIDGEVIVDAIFGLGFEGDFIGYPAKMMDFINQGNYRRIAIDIPSGVNATTGEASSHAFNADYTVTFSYPKIGLLKSPAILHTGRLVTVNIGIPPKGEPIKRKVKAISANPEVIDLNWAQAKLPSRKAISHKGDYGRVLIVAGSKNMCGAAMLSAIAAARSGAGLVNLAVPESLQKVVAPQIPSVITYGLYETTEGTVSPRATAQIIDLAKNADVLAIGPGLTENNQTKALVFDLIGKLRKQKITIPIILDADALNAISEKPVILKELKGNYILTPHPGEMSRILNKKVSVVQKEREKTAAAFAKKHKAVVILKGAFTIIAGPKKEKYINISGNPGMATAGSGDVLLGLVAALVGQKINLVEASALASFIHGLAGDVAQKVHGEESLIATDIIEALPLVLKTIKG